MKQRREVYHEPCDNCRTPCRVPSPNVFFMIGPVYCSPDCRSAHEVKKESERK